MSQARNKNKKVLFISHAEKDIAIVEKFVDLLLHMGISEKAILCSSISELGVPLKVEIYDYLRNTLDSKGVIPIFMLSDNYYKSAACLNEMGAVWIKQTDYFVFLLPGFTFSQIRGAINPRKRGISLDCQSEHTLKNLKADLNRFHTELEDIFSLKPLQFWERRRDEFISAIQSHVPVTNPINMRNHEGFCIGQYTHEGSKVTFDTHTSTLCAYIDFHLTEAEICSAVIYTGERNLTRQWQAGAILSFDLKASASIKTLEVECRLRNHDSRISFPTSELWTHYQFRLSEFPADVSEWVALKEIKFLVRRKSSLIGHFEVKNLTIE